MKCTFKAVTAHSAYWLTLLLVLLLAGTAQAGTKVMLPGQLDEVSQQVELAFDRLELNNRAVEKWPDGLQTVGEDAVGTRLMISLRNAGRDECEMTVESTSKKDSAQDDIEARFLRLMRSR